jgi:hypothetical protein
MSDGSAARLIGDALDLQHRLRLIWAASQAGQVLAYQARGIAKATRHLTAEQAGWVDQKLAPALGALSWGRVQTLLEAAIVEADPVGAEQQAADAAKGAVRAAGPQVRARLEVDHCPGGRRRCHLVQSHHRPDR